MSGLLLAQVIRDVPRPEEPPSSHPPPEADRSRPPTDRPRPAPTPPPRLIDTVECAARNFTRFFPFFDVTRCAGGCESTVGIRHDPLDIQEPPMETERAKVEKKAAEEKIKKLRQEGKKEEADKLEKEKPLTFDELRKKLQGELDKSKEEEIGFNFFYGAMALASGAAVLGSAKTFARQLKVPIKGGIAIDLLDEFTAKADKKSPLETKKVTGRSDIEIKCADAEAALLVVSAATFIGLQGSAKVDDYFNKGGDNKYFTALKKILKVIPLNKIPGGEKVRDKILEMLDASADVDASITTTIKVESPDFGIYNDAYMTSSTVLRKDGDAEVAVNRSNVGRKKDETGKELTDADIKFNRGTSTKNPSHIFFEGSAQANAKALGIGASDTMVRSAWGMLYVCVCRTGEEGNYKDTWNSKIYGGVIGDDNFVNRANELMTKAEEEVRQDLKEGGVPIPKTQEEGDKLNRKMQEKLKEKLGGLFK